MEQPGLIERILYLGHLKTISERHRPWAAAFVSDEDRSKQGLWLAVPNACMFVLMAVVVAAFGEIGRAVLFGLAAGLALFLGASMTGFAEKRVRKFAVKQGVSAHLDRSD